MARSYVFIIRYSTASKHHRNINQVTAWRQNPGMPQFQQSQQSMHLLSASSSYTSSSQAVIKDCKWGSVLVCSESKAFFLSREDRSDDQILSCLRVESPSTANMSLMSAMCHTLLPTGFDKRPTCEQPRETTRAKIVNTEMWSKLQPNSIWRIPITHILGNLILCSNANQLTQSYHYQVMAN